MTLNEFAAFKKRQLFAELSAGQDPSEGVFDPALLREARTKGRPQMGGAVYEPGHLILEFIYPDPVHGSIVVPVRLASPERIVYLGVPSWVVENVWQGEVLGSFHFESHARALVRDFSVSIEPEANQELFGPRIPTGRR